MFCIKCGNKLEEGALFCTQCGARIEYPETAAEPQASVGQTPEVEEVPEQETISGKEEVKGDKPSEAEDAGTSSESALTAEEDAGASSESALTAEEDAGASAEITQSQQQEITDRQDAFEKKGRGKKFMIVAAVCICFLVALVGTGVYLVYQHTNKWNHWVAGYQKSMQEFYLSDEEKKDYEDYLADASEAKNETDREALKAEMEALKEKVQEENTAYLAEIDANKAKVEGDYDLSYALPSEIEMINQSKAKYEELIKNKQYPDAIAETENCMKLETDASRIREGWQIGLHQMDVSRYPDVKLYFTVEDEQGNAVENLQKESFFLSQKKEDSYTLHEITDAVQLNENENININLIADVSGSMDGNMDAVKSVMNQFLDTVQFDVGDQVGLIAFDDVSYYLQDFTNDKSAVSSSINSMELGGLTKLYDTLIEGVQKVLPQSGAKCVIAFTDGYDNRSASSVQDVIDYANMYQVPIFIIGIGSDVDASVLRNIAESTGGFYEAVDYVDESFEDIYAKIYRAQKEIYCLEYTVDGDNMCDTQDISVYIRDAEHGGTVQTQYTAADDFFGILLQQYLTSYVDALATGDYSVMEQAGYLQPEGGIAKEMKSYIKKNEETLSEQLLSCEVTKVKYKDKDTYVINSEEVYDIQQERNYVNQIKGSKQDDEKAAIRFMEDEGYDMEYLEEEDADVSIHKMRKLKGRYVIKRNSEGKWQFAEYKDKYKVMESEVYTAYPLFD